MRRLTRRWLSASATSDISGGVRHSVGEAITSTASRRAAALRANARSRNTREVISRTQALGITQRRSDGRIKLRQPVRQFPVEEAAQLDGAETALKKEGIGGFRLRQPEIARDGAGARERIHRLMSGFGDPRIAVAPQERVADADANPSEVAGASSRDA